MGYYKVVENGYILGVGVGNGATEITAEEYNTILSIVNSKQTETGRSYRLKTDLTWEEAETTDGDIDDTETVDIIFGGAE